jgi:preprotein translocase subunit SecA
LNSNAKIKGRIGQIRTGEGKSTIVAMLSAYFALLNNFVDVITSSPYLAMRDQQKYQPFFETFGITSSHITSRNPKA